MASISRRDAGKILLAGCTGALLPAAKLGAGTRINSVIRGVQIGAQTTCFRGLALDGCIAAMREVGLGECELWWGTLAPLDAQNLERGGRFYPGIGKWALTAPLSSFNEARKKFDEAGIFLYAFCYIFRSDFTDEEIERGFQMARALDVKYITSSANVSVAPRVDKYAQKYKITVGFHGHDQTSDPDEFSTPETFARAMKGASPYIGINLDIGHFTAAGLDPVAYITEHHAKIIKVHLKDRKKNHGPAMPFGEGDTPIVAVLQLLRDKGWEIPANIEHEYGKRGSEGIPDVKKCFEYCKKALES